MSQTLLHIDASSTGDASITRQLTRDIVAKLAPTQTITRDLVAEPLPLITPEWNALRGLPEDQLGAEDKSRLALSDTLIGELVAADTIVIGAPIYNFGVPAALKAWADLVGRPGRTFRYSEAGPEGLMTGKRAIVAIASGGTPIGSDADFVSGYVPFFLGFIGIKDVTLIKADRVAFAADAALQSAGEQIAALGT